MHPVYTIPKIVFSCSVRDIHIPNPSGDATCQTRTITLCCCPGSLYRMSMNDNMSTVSIMEGHFCSFENNFLQLVTFPAQKYDRRFFHIKTKKRTTEIPTTNAKNYAVLRPEQNGRYFADSIFISCVFPEWNPLYFLIQKEKIVTLTRQNAMVKFVWVSCSHTRTLQIVQKRRDLIEIEYIAVECEPSVIREVFFIFLNPHDRRRAVK